MNSNTNRKEHEQAGLGWPVFVGFDGAKAQQRASEVCELMTRQFWPDIEFELHKCDFTQLSDPGYRQDAIRNAASARIVIVAVSSPDSLDQPLVEWMEGLCLHRHNREGVLVGLVDPVAEDEVRENMDLRLRNLAHRTGLDYLTHAPNCRALGIPDESDWVEARAGKLGPVLEHILDRPNDPGELLRL